MRYMVFEDGVLIAHFVRHEDATEFLSHLQYERGDKGYELRDTHS